VHRGSLHAYEAAYAPSSSLPDHQHASPFFTYVLRGGYIERVGQIERKCVRGAVIFHAHNESHANVVSKSGTASLNVEINDDAWRELTSDVVRACDLVGRVLSGDVEWVAMSVWREFYHDDSSSTLALEEAIAMLCSHVNRSASRGMFEPHERLDRCIDYLRLHTTQTPTLAEVAAIAGVHPMHLAKLFRKRFGYSMGEFVRRQRIGWACDQLSRDAGTISSIAARAGFADHAHFTRTFRRVTGCTPIWYRENVRNANRSMDGV
jgi:AraC family transcriptional regulator